MGNLSPYALKRAGASIAVVGLGIGFLPPGPRGCGSLFVPGESANYPFCSSSIAQFFAYGGLVIGVGLFVYATYALREGAAFSESESREFNFFGWLGLVLGLALGVLWVVFYYLRLVDLDWIDSEAPSRIVLRVIIFSPLLFGLIFGLIGGAIDSLVGWIRRR